MTDLVTGKVYTKEIVNGKEEWVETPAPLPVGTNFGESILTPEQRQRSSFDPVPR